MGRAILWWVYCIGFCIFDIAMYVEYGTFFTLAAGIFMAFCAVYWTVVLATRDF